MATSTKNDANPNAGNPFAELSKMYEQFKVPGLDLSTIADARRKDVEALVQANKAVYDGMQALAAKQTEMFRQAMVDIQGAVGTAGTNPAAQTELARKAYEKALADMKELAEIARQSQAEAMASISERATQNLQEIRDMVKKQTG
ncbi:phasin family protein [Advenella mimigardefordensis]|uniref:Putative phasin n=1 Tax=Advenella mimigardefordensis (strain DSM 17166 / LMG 22922 / DPN7) TaxID=1247726 RepID=W0PIE7_ADVMD|nr:phasin family protein [Advenella mimigardefordensis]AHG65687.1 putative phasin [Advenella mimigardefordensis DPN7]